MINFFTLKLILESSQPKQVYIKAGKNFYPKTHLNVKWRFSAILKTFIKLVITFIQAFKRYLENVEK